MFSPDGRRVATICSMIGRIWDAATGEPLTPRLLHKARLLTAAFTPDGEQLLTGDMDGTVKIWELPQDRRPPSEAVLEAQLLAGQRIDQTGGLVPLTPAELVKAWRALRGQAADREPDPKVH